MTVLRDAVSLISVAVSSISTVSSVFESAVPRSVLKLKISTWQLDQCYLSFNPLMSRESVS